MLPGLLLLQIHPWLLSPCALGWSAALGRGPPLPFHVLPAFSSEASVDPDLLLLIFFP